MPLPLLVPTGGAYEPSSLPAYPEPLDLSHDLTIQLDNPSMTSFTASEPIRAMRFEGSDDEAEAERQLQEELAAADVAVMADVLDVLTVRRSNSRARLHLGSLPHDLVSCAGPAAAVLWPVLPACNLCDLVCCAVGPLACCSIADPRVGLHLPVRFMAQTGI